MTPTIWLFGEREKSGFDVLAAVLTEAGCRVDFVPSAQARQWCHSSEDVTLGLMPPNLIVAAAELAFDEEHLLLNVLQQRQPWSFVPLVVVGREEDAARCQQVYQLGAASWVVLPWDAALCEKTARVFARYWTRTTLLPDIHAFRL